MPEVLGNNSERLTPAKGGDLRIGFGHSGYGSGYSEQKRESVDGANLWWIDREEVARDVRNCRDA